MLDYCLTILNNSNFIVMSTKILRFSPKVESVNLLDWPSEKISFEAASAILFLLYSSAHHHDGLAVILPQIPKILIFDYNAHDELLLPLFP